MKVLRTTTILIILISFAISCKNVSGSSEKPTDPKTEQEETVEKKGPALSGIFMVEDFNQWLTVYNREVARERQIEILKSIENNQLIFVIQWSDGHQKAREMMASPEARQVLEEGTVTSEMQIQYFDVEYLNTSNIDDSLRLAVNLEVMNYDIWKADFDRDAQYREDAGLNLMGLARDADNDNLIYMVFATNDKQKVYDIMNSPELKQAIYESGVVGEPNVSWWRTIKSEVL